MNLLRKFFVKINTYIMTKYNGTKSIKIQNYANSHVVMHRFSVQGNGILKLSPNSIRIGEHLKLRVDEGAKLNINGVVSFFTNTNIHVGRNAVLSVGNGTYVNEGTKISIKTKCLIGEGCAISNDVTILDSDFHSIIGSKRQDVGVVIGNHVWIGANVIILKNVKIGDNCIIGAGTLVTKDIPDGCLVVGNPARIIQKNVNWE